MEAHITLLIIQFVAGMAMLYLGAEWFVKGSSGLAAAFRVTPLLIGLLVVSTGTSAPELLVSLLAALKKSGDISIGNIIGSNIANVGLILGISSIIRPIKIKENFIRRELPFMIFVSVLFFILTLNGNIGAIDGVLLLFLLFFFINYSYKNARKDHTPPSFDFSEKKSRNKKTCFLLTFLGCIALLIGSQFIVSSGIVIARRFGISELIIGISIIAVGTSLPELAAASVAVLKNEFDLCVGNIVGSNIFNLLFVIGLVSIIHPLQVKPDVIWVHLPVMVIFSAVLIPIMKKDFIVTRMEGIMLVCGYFIYVTCIFFY